MDFFFGKFQAIKYTCKVQRIRGRRVSEREVGGFSNFHLEISCSAVASYLADAEGRICPYIQSTRTNSTCTYLPTDPDHNWSFTFPYQ